MLSPFRFLSDMYIRGNNAALWHMPIEFPLERLNYMISNKIWSDPESETLWNSTYPHAPYQLWTSDPTSTKAVLNFQDIEMECRWCGKTGMYDLSQFTLMHTQKLPVCRCPSCKHTFNADSLSAQNLKADLVRFVETKRAWYFPRLVVL